MKNKLMFITILGLTQVPYIVHANRDKCVASVMPVEDKAVENESEDDLSFLFEDVVANKQELKTETASTDLNGVKVERVEVPNSLLLVDANPTRRAANHKKAKALIKYLEQNMDDAITHQIATDDVLKLIHRATDTSTGGLLASRFLDEKMQTALATDIVHTQATGDFQAFVTQMIELSPEKNKLIRLSHMQKLKNGAVRTAKTVSSLVPFFGSRISSKLNKSLTTQDNLTKQYVENIVDLRSAINSSINSIDVRGKELLGHIETMKKDRIELLVFDKDTNEQIAFLSELDNAIIEHIKTETTATSPERSFLISEILTPVRIAIVELQMMGQALTQALVLNYTNIQRNTDLVVRTQRSRNRLIVILSTSAQQAVVMNAQRRQALVLDFADQSAAVMLNSNATLFEENGKLIRSEQATFDSIVVTMKTASETIAREYKAMEAYRIKSADNLAKTSADLEVLLVENRVFVKQLDIAEKTKGTANQIVYNLNLASTQAQKSAKRISSILNKFETGAPNSDEPSGN